MKRFMLVAMSVLMLTATFASSASIATAKETKILDFDTMIGVPQQFTGSQATATFRNVPAGGLPWTLSSAKGQLKASGELEIEVKGLVLAAGPNAFTNTVGFFRGLVSCIGSDGLPHNVMTDPFPATMGPAKLGGGNSTIEATVALPNPCFAPIVFVTSPGGAWFAVTGN